MLKHDERLTIIIVIAAVMAIWLFILPHGM